MPEVPRRKDIRKEVRFDGYTKKLVDALMATGDFGNVADLIRTAIHNLYAKYEAHQMPADLQSDRLGYMRRTKKISNNKSDINYGD